MRSINSILVPVDFSGVSANAFHYALRLANALDAEVNLLYAVPPTDAGGLLSMQLTEQLISIGKEKLADFFAQGMSAVSGQLEHIPSVRSYVTSENLQAAIRKHITAQGNDLIIMGTHREAGNMVAYFGSNTSQTVDKAPCPVLVIPEGFSFQPLRSICYATDLTHLDAFHAGHLLKALRVFHPRLDFVHVKTSKAKKTEFDMDLLREVFDRPETGLNTRFHILKDEDVAEEVFDYAKATEADLVVMHRPRQGWLSRLFGTSTTREAVLEATLPLLIVPWTKAEDALENEANFTAHQPAE